MSSIDGAKVEIPTDATPKDHYQTPDFERQITLPDRVKVHCEHLIQSATHLWPHGKNNGLLRQPGSCLGGP